jgi:hypothetical protein
MVYSGPQTVRTFCKLRFKLYGLLTICITVWTAFFKEEQQGKDLVDAAKKAGVKHFIWVTLDHSGVPHFDTKARVDDYLKASGVPRTSYVTRVQRPNRHSSTSFSH